MRGGALIDLTLAHRSLPLWAGDRTVDCALNLGNARWRFAEPVPHQGQRFVPRQPEDALYTYTQLVSHGRGAYPACPAKSSKEPWFWSLWLGWFVLIIWLIWFIWLVSFNQKTRQTRQTKQTKQTRETGGLFQPPAKRPVLPYPAQDVRLADENEFLTVQIDFARSVFLVEDLIARFEDRGLEDLFLFTFGFTA